MVSINFICIDSVSVCFSPSVLRKMFKEVAIIGHIYCHYHQKSSLKYDNPVKWYSNTTQTVWLSIREWVDTDEAFKIISELKKGKSSISTDSNSHIIEFEATDFNDIRRFPIDTHSLPTKKTRYSLDTVFDTFKPKYRSDKNDIKNNLNAKLKRRFECSPKKIGFMEPDFVPIAPKKVNNNLQLAKNMMPVTLSLIHPDLIDNNICIDCEDDECVSLRLPSDDPYVIDMFSVDDDDDLDNLNCHKRQKTLSSEILVYNLHKFDTSIQIE